MKSYDSPYTEKDNYVVGVYIRMDKSYDSYSRKVTDILTLLGDIGGLNDFFVGVGALVIGFFAQNSLWDLS